MIARAKDQFVWDADGNQYLDFFGGIVTVSVGHCNETVNRKTAEQMERLQHVSTVFANEPQAALAKRIAEITPGGKLTKSFFTNSGTEANETAILTARCYTGNHEIVALAARLSRPFRGRHGRHRTSHLAAGRRAPVRVRPCAERLLLPLPAGADLSLLQRAVRARHGRADPHLHLRPHRRIHCRADSRRRRLHHAA